MVLVYDTRSSHLDVAAAELHAAGAERVITAPAIVAAHLLALARLLAPRRFRAGKSAIRHTVRTEPRDRVCHRIGATASRRRDGRRGPPVRAVCLAYPAVHQQIPAPSAEVAALAAHLPPLARFTPEMREDIYRAYLGPGVRRSPSLRGPSPTSSGCRGSPSSTPSTTTCGRQARRSPPSCARLGSRWTRGASRARRTATSMPTVRRGDGPDPPPVRAAPRPAPGGGTRGGARARRASGGGPAQSLSNPVI